MNKIYNTVRNKYIKSHFKQTPQHFWMKVDMLVDRFLLLWERARLAISHYIESF